MSDTFFGTWAGLAVNDTSQVVATGLIYSQKAAEVAMVVKLRNLFMAPVIVVLSWYYLYRQATHTLSQFLIVCALGGVGLEAHVGAIKRIGLRPFYAGLCAAAFMTAVSFTLITLVGIR
jgi:uncharacterized membrane protein YadS